MKPKISWNKTLLAIMMFLMVAPVVLLALISLKPDVEILRTPLAPFMPTFDHYTGLITRFGFAQAVLNSAIIAVIVLVITIPTASLAAYGLSRFPLPGVQWILVFLLFCRAIMPALLIIPLFEVIRVLGLRNTVAGIVLGHLSWQLPLAVLLFYGFAESMSKEIEEAAWIDGLSRFQSFWRIVFPLMAPSIAVVGLFTFGGSWGEFLFSTAFSTSSSGLRTGPVYISSMMTEYRGPLGELAAVGIVWSIPIMIVALIFHKYMIKGMRLGF